jgi:hypothetical protein
MPYRTHNLLTVRDNRTKKIVKTRMSLIKGKFGVFKELKALSHWFDAG